MARALESGKLNPQESATAATACGKNFQDFFAGYETVMRHGRLTSAGREIMARAFDYMNAERPGSRHAQSSGIPAQ